MKEHIVISDRFSEKGIEILSRDEDIQITYDPALTKDLQKLKDTLATATALIVRSETKVTKELIELAPHLKIIGRAGIGVDNIDIPTATARGIIVMNAPSGNSITTAEHAIAHLCSLARCIPQATASLKMGRWEKSAFKGVELFNKTLGIIGLGNIGKIVADRAKGLKMIVQAYDPYLSDTLAHELDIKKVTLDELFTSSDFITLHTPLLDQTRHIVNETAFKKMKKTAFIINCARGGLIDESALYTALTTGQIAGAALDVFETEPVPADHPLLTLPNLIATPHLGASTQEAQENVSIEIVSQILDYLKTGNIINSVNTLNASAKTLKRLENSLTLAEVLGKMCFQFHKKMPHKLQIRYYGQLCHEPTPLLTTRFLQGMLSSTHANERINAVNSLSLSKQMGISIEEIHDNSPTETPSLFEVTARGNDFTLTFQGFATETQPAKVLKIENCSIEFAPKGKLVYIINDDIPGVVGSVGLTLANHQINISTLQLALDENQQKAHSVYRITGSWSEALKESLLNTKGVVSCHFFDL